MMYYKPFQRSPFWYQMDDDPVDNNGSNVLLRL
jgi:hypothetical protein